MHNKFHFHKINPNFIQLRYKQGKPKEYQLTFFKAHDFDTSISISKFNDPNSKIINFKYWRGKVIAFLRACAQAKINT